jgi:hypothetical protein
MKNTKLYSYIVQVYNAGTLADIAEYGCLSCAEKELNNKRALKSLVLSFKNDIESLFAEVVTDAPKLQPLLNKKIGWIHAVYVVNYIASEYVSSSPDQLGITTN